MSEADEAKMSKYARKVAARREAASRALGAIDFAVRITERQIPQPKPQPTAKPKQPPPPPRSQINDLGRLPQQLSAALAEVVVAIRKAEGIVAEIQGLANPGRQSAEPLAMAQFLITARPRFDAMMERAARIPNKPQRRGEDDDSRL